MTDQTPLEVVTSQIESGKDELAVMPPDEIDWRQRCIETSNLLIPWLQASASMLKQYVEQVMNSRDGVRKRWNEAKGIAGSQLPKELVVEMDRELDLEAILLDYIGGDTISKVIEKYLIENCPDRSIESNGRSDYPDLFFRSKDYSSLPKFRRLQDNSVEYGAALKGKKERPVRVPDGLEIKTCRGKFAVDCHHAHQGLHLALLFHVTEGMTTVDDVLIAFMQSCDYRITQPNTPTTTLKASFQGDNFISLLTTDAKK